jgi:uncharacterized membrane protein
MARILPRLPPSVTYAFRGGFLLRPFVIAVFFGTAGAVLSALEERMPGLSAFVPAVLFPSHADPQIAQDILSDIATSTMTVVSIVFAILLMTLTLASTQFSPRILINFIRDRVTQWTLGMFLGTFSYCIAALPAARSLPYPFVPVATVTVAMLLVPVCVGWLIFFIQHISNAISVNHIVDRIRRETELVIDELMPEPRRPLQREIEPGTFPADREYIIRSRRSGYIRFVRLDRLRELAIAYRICLRVERRIGQFIPEGVALLRVSSSSRLAEERVAELLATFDIGPARTLQQDVEFGIVQIVDIGLKAISPAVNDPTTTISCVDQLTCILIRWLDRAPPLSNYYAPPHVLRLVVPWISFKGLFDLAFEQIRHYAVGDAAVSLRLMRAISDIASTVEDPLIQGFLLDRGKRVVAGCTGRLQEDDLERLRQRLGLFATQEQQTSPSRSGYRQHTDST